MKKLVLLWAAVCLVAAVATACGGSSDYGQGQSGSATATAGASETVKATATSSATTITIASMSYGEPVTAPPGAQIAVKNNDPMEHSVTSDAAGAFTVDVDGNDNGTFTAPSAPGEYTFHCKYHPAMHGTLIVK